MVKQSVSINNQNVNNWNQWKLEKEKKTKNPTLRNQQQQKIQT